MTTLWDRLNKAWLAGLAAFRETDVAFGLSATEAADLSDEDRQRLERYRLLWDYYHGRHKKPLKVRSGKPDDNVIINRSRRVVDKGVSFLFGPVLSWDITRPGEMQTENTELENAINSVWGSLDKRMAFLHKVALNGAVCGTFFVQIAVTDDVPRLVNLAPSTVFPTWNPDDVSDLWAIKLQWRSGGGVLRRRIFALNDAGQWEQWAEVRQAQRWEMDGDRSVWPYDWPPVVYGQNLPNPNEFWGLSDLEDADMNDAINASASGMCRGVRLFSTPLIWGWGFGGRDSLDVEDGQAVLSRSGQAHLAAIEASGNLGGAQAFHERLQTDYSEISRVPSFDPTLMSLGAQSGFALQVLYGDLIEKTWTKRRLYGMAIVEIQRRLAEILGVEGVECFLHWGNPLPHDQRESMDQDKFELDYGLASKQTVQKRRGLDPELEAERLAEEAAGQMTVGEQLLRAFDQGR